MSWNPLRREQRMEKNTRQGAILQQRTTE